MLSEEAKAAFENVSPLSLEAFGFRSQMIKTCEELGELSAILCKRLNGSPATHEQVVDEIADVLIMAHQMRVVFGPGEVDTRIVFKLERTRSYILNNTLKQGEIYAEHK